MKILFPALTLFALLSAWGCQRDDATGDNEIQREEEYNRDDLIEKRNLPSPQDAKDLDFDRDILDTDVKTN